MNIAEIPQAVLDLLGPIVGLRLPAQGHTSSVAQVTTPGGDYIVKRCEHPLYRSWLRKEHRNLLLLQATGLPVPRIEGFVEESRYSWLVMSYIEGIRLREHLANENNASKRERALRGYGAVLKRIHETICPPDLAGEGDWLESMLRQAKYNSANFEVDGTEALLAELESVRPAPIAGTLIHGDFTIDNVLVRDSEVVGVIDWAGAAFGDPRYDVSLAIRPKPNAFQQKRDGELFYEAYGRLRVSEWEYRYYEEGLYAFF